MRRRVRPGTGYNKKVFDGPFVSPAMGNITVTMRGAAAGAARTAGDGSGVAGGSPAWGAVYWQYFDILERITPPGASKAPLKLTKKLFIERNTDRGRVLEPVEDKGVLKPGDKVIVRIELQADRSMEYVHMKDMRAACMEPVNVLSQYKWQGGLGYYESTKDASTDFFFASMPRGTYVLSIPYWWVRQAILVMGSRVSSVCMRRSLRIIVRGLGECRGGAVSGARYAGGYAWGS